MAITPTAVAGAGSIGSIRAFDVEATLDADDTLTFNHGVPFADATEAAERSFVIIQPLEAGAAAARLSAWCASVPTATQITIVKTTALGSGTTGAQVRITIGRWAQK